tara:strand:+ start:525 stop:968 length:444 start_codon:yes stop_codon:yes gene_type:complete
MRKDSNGNIIGAGEDTAVELLEEILMLYKEKLNALNTKYEIKRQYPLQDILTDEFKESLNDSYLKHKIDIVIIREPEKPIAVRVQGKDHEGVLKSARDVVQKKVLEWHGFIVVDLNWYDCPILFKEKNNKDSMIEVRNSLSEAGLHL